MNPIIENTSIQRGISKRYWLKEVVKSCKDDPALTPEQMREQLKCKLAEAMRGVPVNVGAYQTREADEDQIPEEGNEVEFPEIWHNK